MTTLILALLSISWLGSPLAWRSWDPPHAFLILALLLGLLGMFYRKGHRSILGKGGPRGGRVRATGLTVLTGVLLLGAAGLALGLGYAPRWISFTYGNLFLGHSHGEVLSAALNAGWRALVMALVGEEFVFRGVVLPGLISGGLGRGKAVMFQALAFGLFVMGKAPGSLPERVPALLEGALMGSILGLLYLMTGSVWTTALARAGFDALNRKIMSDVNLRIPGIFHYVVADPRFVWLRVGILALPALVLAWAWRKSIKVEGKRLSGSYRGRLMTGPASERGGANRKGRGSEGTTQRHSERTGWALMAGALVVVAAWTLSIKFFVPIQMAMTEGLSWNSYVLWDFWWVLHLYLALALVRKWPKTQAAAVIISVVEIGIVLVKLNAYLTSPYGGIWRAHWFYNKLVVLLVFCVLLRWLMNPGVRMLLETPEANSRDA